VNHDDENIDAILATYGKSIQHEDKRRSTHPSPHMLRRMSAYWARHNARVVQEAEADLEADVVADWREEQALQSCVLEIRDRYSK